LYACESDAHHTLQHIGGLRINYISNILWKYFSKLTHVENISAK
jgi:hypothetical protein